MEDPWDAELFWLQHTGTHRHSHSLATKLSGVCISLIGVYGWWWCSVCRYGAILRGTKDDSALSTCLLGQTHMNKNIAW